MSSFTPIQSPLWSLVRGNSATIDPFELLQAIEREAQSGDELDFRTRLLIRDGLHALTRHWGSDGPLRRLTPIARTRIDAIIKGNAGEEVGFPTLESRLMEHADPDLFLHFLRELGTAVREPTRLEIGGSGALILAGLLNRSTDDLDSVDEVPAVIRADPALIDSLAERFGLRLTHFQSHYLPQGWRDRLRSLGRFGMMDVFLVDVHDVFMSKLFSHRDRDRDDLRALYRSLDKNLLTARLRQNCGALLAEPALRQHATRNWYILYGEPLPTGTTAT